ncbi:MAG: cyclic pyranopterin monophosphate synthase MoaC [Candidatus Schekmanbacteria bacterium]|nr:cyclic pyranopterin monophosphate synthase MoaC [Candidatus Schekmanbacteria bacterium]
MIDVSSKPSVIREAIAAGEIQIAPQTLERIRENKIPKGQVLEVARIAAIMAAKDTPRLIPLCHPITINTVKVDFALQEQPSLVQIQVYVKGIDRTGVEMEALTATAAAALTIYDMCKMLDKEMVISQIRLLSKTKGEPHAD